MLGLSKEEKEYKKYKNGIPAKEFYEVLTLAIEITNFCMDKFLNEDLMYHVEHYKDIKEEDQIASMGITHKTYYDNDELENPDKKRHYVIDLLSFLCDWYSCLEVRNNSGEEMSVSDIKLLNTERLKIIKVMLNKYLSKIGNIRIVSNNFEIMKKGIPISIEFPTLSKLDFDINYVDKFLSKKEFTIMLKEPIRYIDRGNSIYNAIYQKNAYVVLDDMALSNYIDFRDYVNANRYLIDFKLERESSLGKPKILTESLFETDGTANALFIGENVLGLYDLSKVDFVGKSLANLDISKNIENLYINFSKLQKDLENANVQGYDLSKVTFVGWNLKNTDLRNTGAKIDLLSCNVTKRSKMSSGTLFDDKNTFCFGDKNLTLEEVENLRVKIYRKEK